MNASHVDLERGREVLREFRANLTKLQRRPQVLVVEDDGADVDLFKKKLEKYRVSVDVAETSERAIEALKAQSYDVVFLDLRLPGGSGLDVLTYACAQAERAFYIVVTGVDDSNPMIREALDRGASFIIQKPVTDEHLQLIFGTLP